VLLRGLRESGKLTVGSTSLELSSEPSCWLAMRIEYLFLVPSRKDRRSNCAEQTPCNAKVNLNAASSFHSITESVDHSYDLHLEDIKDPEGLEQALMYIYVALSISILASTFGKMTMALFLVRILGRSTEKRYLWFLYSITFTMVGLDMLAIGILVGGWFPMQKTRIPSLSRMCINSDMLEYGGRI
jgi:hypothetical protein